ncbi:MAG: C25 family cysteine peptidase [Planctomycetota bacterium]|jgi:hypothetical protein
MRAKAPVTRSRILVLSAALTFGMAASGYAQDLTLIASDTTPEVNDEVTVTFWIDSCPSSDGMQVFLDYDPTFLIVLSVVVGSLNPDPPNTLMSNDDDVNGYLFAMSGSSTGDNAAGDGSLAVVTFRVIKSETTTVTTYNYGVSPADEFGNKIEDSAETVYIPNPVVDQITFTISPYTPVVMSSARARSAGIGAVVEWTTASELDNAGFDVLRRPAGSGEFRAVTPRAVEGRITATGAKRYRWFDPAPAGRWEYRVETISTTGARERHGSAEDMTVSIRRRDAVRSLGALPRLWGPRLAGAFRRLRSRAETRVRRRELASRGARPGPASSGTAAPAGPDARILASVADRTGALPPRRGASPASGDSKILTRGDGVFFVPAGALGVPPGRAALVTGGVASPPLASGPEGAWFFAPGYLDSYTDLNATFVSACGGSRSGGQRPSSAPAAPAVTTARAVARAERDEAYCIGVPALPDPWVYSRYITDSSGEFEVPLDVPGLVAGPATLRVAVCGYTEDEAVSPDHELIVSLNGSALTRFLWDGRDYQVFEVALPEGALADGANTVSLLSPASPAIPGGQGAVLDYVEVEHARRLSLDDGAFALELAPGAPAGTVEVGLADAAGRPWVAEVDGAGAVRRVVPRVRARQNGGGARFEARAGFAYYVAAADDVRAPVSVGSASVAEVAPGTEYLAVGPEDFRAAAAPLLGLRSAEGLASAYVSLVEAADTWGWGRYGAPGIAEAVSAVGPGYVLLVGDNAYDYLGRAPGEADPMVPAPLARSSRFAETNADALYGDTDSDGVPDVAVGRLPVRTTEELSRLVTKILSHDMVGSTPAGVLLAGRSDEDEDEDFAGASRRIAERFGGVDWTELYAGVHGDERNVAAALAGAVEVGQDLVVYQGHGTFFALGKGTPLLDVEAAAAWPSCPVVYLSTCWGAFIQRETVEAETIAETLLRGEAGSPAVIGTAAPCTQEAQEMLLGGFLDGALGSASRAGDALVAAQRSCAERAAAAGGDGAYGETLLDVARFYVLLGDPAMRLVEDPVGD